MLPALALAAMVAQAPATAATAPPAPLPQATLTAGQWREAARQDIEAIHDTLRDNAPFMVVDRDSAGMRRWLETGRAAAIGALPTVTDAYTYSFLLRRYLGGFRDGHMNISTPPIPGFMPAWPGFVTVWKQDRYVVGWRAPEAAAYAPPVGAELVSCDGRSAMALADERLDGVLGDLTLASGRSRSAFQLLRDYRDPRAPPPKSCVFRAAEETRTWPLTWTTPPGAEVEVAARAVMEPRGRFGVDRWGENAWWIGVPAMVGDNEWKALNAGVEANLAAIRAADVTVIDLRGNGGGNSDLGTGLARRLYGRPIVDANDPPWGDLVFKVGTLSRKWAAGSVDFARRQSPDNVPEAIRISAALDEAPLGSRVVIPGEAAKPGSKTLPNPMHGRVVLLIDHACFSACLDTLDLFTRLPGVTLAGVTTGADTVFMDSMSAPLPSGRATLRFGIKAWSQRRRGSNVAYEPAPDLRYTGDLTDEAGLKRWLAGKLGVKGL